MSWNNHLTIKPCGCAKKQITYDMPQYTQPDKGKTVVTHYYCKKHKHK